MKYVAVRGFSFAKDSDIRASQRKGEAYEKGSYEVARYEAGDVFDRAALPADVLRACKMAANPIIKALEEHEAEPEATDNVAEESAGE